MKTKPLGRLEKVELRSYWQREDTHFTSSGRSTGSDGPCAWPQPEPDIDSCTSTKTQPKNQRPTITPCSRQGVEPAVRSG